MASLSIINLKKSYGDTDILKGISLAIKDKEFICFLGPSGCGKSTLLRTIAGLEEFDSGEIRIDDRLVNDVPPAERDLAMVFQSYALYPHMNVRKNMSFGLLLRKFPKAEIELRIQEAARILQLEDLLERKPKQLSGGQRQRVAIGRAIVRNPKIFLFDEPLSNLDAALRANTRVEIARLHKQLEATMIYVTHDQVEAMTLADRVVILNAGKIEQFGMPLELYHCPANRFVAGFIGSPKMNFLNVSVCSKDRENRLTVQHGDQKIATNIGNDQINLKEQLCLGIRPEHMSLAPPPKHNEQHAPRQSDLRGEVLLVERLGAESIAHIRLTSGETIMMNLDGLSTLKNGEKVDLCIAPDHIHLFKSDGSAVPRPKPSSVHELF